MKTLNVTKELSSEDVVREAQDSEVILMSNGHPVALVSALDDEELGWLEYERSPEFAAAMQRAREQVAKGQTYSHEDVVKMLGIDLNSVATANASPTK